MVGFWVVIVLIGVLFGLDVLLLLVIRCEVFMLFMLML